ncbi:cystathionine gamma-synthase [Sesbania bispinosa]|nr:cystathionine gamma-synthase [Sesbania bispinosa]
MPMVRAKHKHIRHVGNALSITESRAEKLQHHVVVNEMLFPLGLTSHPFLTWEGRHKNSKRR